MAALNISETEMLRDATAMLQYILEHGYDPAKAEEKGPDAAQAVYTKTRIKKTLDEVKTVVAMKGHYFN